MKRFRKILSLGKCQQYADTGFEPAKLPAIRKRSLSSIPTGTPIPIPSCSSTYSEAYHKSLNNPQDFWNEAAQDIVWFKKYDQVLDSSRYPFTKWFKGGELNLCYNCLDRHIEGGFGAQEALIYDSPVTQTIKKYSYLELLHEVTELAKKLRFLGVQKNDRVLIYMPMIPEAIVGMLACARLGAPHSVVFGGFAAKELATRIRHIQPKVILSSNVGIEPTRIIPYKPLLDEAIKLVGADDGNKIKCIIYNRKNFPRAELHSQQDFDWEEMTVSEGPIDSVPVPSDHPLYILYTSGTTGMPKGVQRSTGAHGVVLPWTLKNVFGMKTRGEGFWAASDVGWVVGHSYICYGPLLSGLRSVLYEGKPVGTPDAAQFYRVISEHKLNGLFVAPTALRAIRKEDPQNLLASNYSRETLRFVFVAGEHCDSETRIWAEKSFQVPVLDNWWQTETGHPITATCVGLDQNQNPPIHSSGHAVPGYQLEILKENGQKAECNEMGRIVIKYPLPPGFMDTLYKGDELFTSAYFKRFPGYYDTMDSGYMDKEGYVYVMARNDDVLNISGHRISSSALEEAVCSHPFISDAAVVGVPDNLKGQIPLAVYVIKEVVGEAKKSEEEINKSLRDLVRTQIGPVAAFKLAISVRALPRTRSGKTPRKTIADLASDKIVQVPPTIEDATVYPEILKALNRIGYGLKSKLKY